MSIANAANAATASAAAAAAAVGLYMPQTYSFLSPETFETLVEGYINQLHIRKRNKALINQQLANDCLMVLTNPENTAIFNPKFRWWVRKHFVFTVVGELRILMDKKNGKPVCVREQLYDKVCYFHHIIGHGGRDKTFAAITKSYSKVPAELVSLFTKNCQTCLGVRKYSKNKRPILNEFEYPGHPQTPQSSQQQQQQQPTPPPQQQHHHHLQQQQSLHHVHPHPLQLTCNTSAFSTSNGTGQGTANAFHSMMKSEHGTISPISPIMNHSGSSFFGSNHLHSMYAQQHHQHQQHQQQQPQHHHHQHQLQQHHHAALATHLNISMSLSDMALGGHLSDTTATGAHNSSNSNGGFPSPTTPTILTKLELPLHQLMQQHEQHQHLLNTGLHSPTDLPDHHFAAQLEQQSSSSPTCSSVDAYSPTLQEHFHHDQQHYHHQHQHHAHHQQHQHHQHQQHHQQQEDDYSQSFSSYSAAAAAAALSLSAFQNHQPYSSPPPSSSSSSSSYQQLTPSPTLSQAQIFHKQIQQEHQRYQHQQQHQQHQNRFSPDVIMTCTSASAVPSMASPSSNSVSAAAVAAVAAVAAAAAAASSSSIPTTVTSSSLANLLDSHMDHESSCSSSSSCAASAAADAAAKHAQEELEKCQMNAVAELVALAEL